MDLNALQLISLKNQVDQNTASLVEKANQSSLDSLQTTVTNIGNASPKGVYTTVPLLQAAYPTGTTGIYLVTGNVAEVASLAISAAPTSIGNVQVTLNGVATNIAVTSGVAEVESLTVTAPCSSSGNVTVTLNGVGTNVALDSGTDTTTDLVATKIRNTSFSGWTTGGTGSVVTFTASAVGVKTDASYSAGTTGATGTMTTTTQGVDADTTTTVATKIRGTSFSGWTTGGSGTTITFTCNTTGAKTDSVYSAGSTGATGTMTTTTQGVDADYGWYYWNSSTWTRGGTYQATEVGDGTVGVNKLSTDFKRTSNNLLNIANYTAGTGLNTWGTGSATYNSTVVDSTAWITPIISVTPGNIYKILDQNLGLYSDKNICFYDTNGVLQSTTRSNPFTVPTGIYYTRIIGYTDTYNALIQVKLNSDPSTYEAYGYISKIALKDDVDNADENLQGQITTNVNNISTNASEISRLERYKTNLNVFSERNNRLLVNRGEIVTDFNGYTVTSGTVTAGSLFGITRNNPLKMVCDGTTGYCNFTINKSFTFKAGKTYGIWFYCERDTMKKIAILSGWNGASQLFNTGYIDQRGENGWNYVPFTVASDTPITTLTMKLQIYSGYFTDTIPFYIDSIIEERKLKPCIMLAFDNCATNLYSTIYPLLNARGFVGTYAYGSGKSPVTNPGGVTYEQYQELMNLGWDYSNYGWLDDATHIMPTTTDGKADWANYDNIYGSLKNSIDAYINDGIPVPVAYFCPVGVSTAPMIKALKALGLKIARHGSGFGITNYSYDGFETATTQIQDVAGNGSLASVEALIDTCITQGKCLSIFCHQVVTDPDMGGVNVSSATYTSLLDYIKTKVDAGLVDVITYKEFCNRWDNSIKKYSDIDFERLQFRISQVENRLTAHGI